MHQDKFKIAGSGRWKLTKEIENIMQDIIDFVNNDVDIDDINKQKIVDKIYNYQKEL